MQVPGALQLAGVGERAGVEYAQAGAFGEFAELRLAWSSSAATKTSSGWPATWPSRSEPAKVVLNALTTLAPGALSAISRAAEPAATVSGA